MKLLLKRRLNPFLLLTTIIGLSLLAGVSILYQTELEDLNEEKSGYNQTIQDLESRNAVLKENITRLSENIDQKDAEITNMSTENANLRSKNRDLKKNQTRLKGEVNDLEGDLEEVCDTLGNTNETAEECDGY